MNMVVWERERMLKVRGREIDVCVREREIIRIIDRSLPDHDLMFYLSVDRVGTMT